VWRQHGGSTPVYIVGGCILAVLLLLGWSADVAAERRRSAAAGQEAGQAEAEPAGERAPAFPVPPLDLPHYHGVGVVIPGGEPEASQTGPVKEVTGA
jgi:NADH-quinone oxidoreductase subunit H